MTIHHKSCDDCRKPLQNEDMWDLPPKDQSKQVTSDFDKNWQEELKRPHPSLVRGATPMMTVPSWSSEGLIELAHLLSLLMLLRPVASILAKQGRRR